MLGTGYGSACLWFPEGRRVQSSMPAWVGHPSVVILKHKMRPGHKDLDWISVFYLVCEARKNPKALNIALLRF